MSTPALLRRPRLPDLSLAVLVLAVLGLTGCFSLSVNPLYDRDTLTYEPGLIGLWGAPGDPDSETWEFRPAGNRAYRLIIREGNTLRLDPERDAAFTAHLLRLEDQLYLDLFPDEPPVGSDFFKSHIVPAHSLWKVRLEGHALTLSLFGSSFLDDALASGEVKIGHIKRDGVLVFTAETADLQQLVARYSDRIFEDSETMQRLQ
jgi:hypothetical protein